jgi:hypothetical protein
VRVIPAPCGNLPHSAKGRFLTEVHAVLGFAVLAANVLAAGWGAAAWLRKIPSISFWYVLRGAQALVVVQVVAGFILFARGLRAPDGLHLVYGVSPLVVTLVSEAMRAGVAAQEVEGVEDLDALDRREQAAIARRVVLREMGIMTVGALLIVTLSLRAVQSGG